jgi:hypothetical protein
MSKELTVIDQREVTFYGGELIAAQPLFSPTAWSTITA